MDMMTLNRAGSNLKPRGALAMAPGHCFVEQGFAEVIASGDCPDSPRLVLRFDRAAWFYAAGAAGRRPFSTVSNEC